MTRSIGIIPLLEPITQCYQTTNIELLSTEIITLSLDNFTRAEVFEFIGEVIVDQYEFEMEQNGIEYNEQIQISRSITNIVSNINRSILESHLFPIDKEYRLKFRSIERDNLLTFFIEY